MLKLNLACGVNYKDGWWNVDLNENVKTDQYFDLTKKLPWCDNSVDFIHNEHFAEHLTKDEGKFFLKECHRILKPNGVLRIAMPDLQYIVDKYFEKEYGWKDQDWLNDPSIPEGLECKTAAEMLNVSFRSWDHKHLYDRETLMLYLQEVGFDYRYMQYPPINFSCWEELQNLETRADSRLIMEAIK